METSLDKERRKWYVGGLHFECLECGRCCSGPEEGYIWVNRPEIERIAGFLKITLAELRSRYLKRVGLRTTILEQQPSKDCIFLRSTQGRKHCMIYSVRPAQCCNWPFWSSNLTSPNAWNQAARTCPGINRGRYYSLEEIEQIRKAKTR